jgi:hypothetical protein
MDPSIVIATEFYSGSRIRPMILGRTHAEVAGTRRPTHDGQFATEFIGSKSEDHHGPVAYFVELPAGGTIRPHFHRANQFQLVVRGGGTIGKRPLAPGYLHYADAFTPYGPIQAGAEGLAFLSLRQAGHFGTHYMPGSKAQQKQRTGRNLTAAVDVVATGATSDSSLDDQDDGVAIHRLEAAPGEPLPRPPLTHGGAYLIVLAGIAVLDECEFPSLSCLYESPDDARDECLVAGAGGTVVAYLSYPRLDSERGLPAREALASGADR